MSLTGCESRHAKSAQIIGQVDTLICDDSCSLERVCRYNSVLCHPCTHYQQCSLLHIVILRFDHAGNGSDVDGFSNVARRTVAFCFGSTQAWSKVGVEGSVDNLDNDAAIF